MSESRKRLHVLQENISEWIAKAENVTCSSCTDPWCCYQVVGAGLAEGLAIADFLIERDGLDAVSDLASDLAKILSVLSDQKMSRMRWFREERVPCIFLKDGQCSIYPVRPNACRVHISFEDPSNCRPDHLEPIARLDTADADEKSLNVNLMADEELGIPFGEGMLQEAVLIAINIRIEGIEATREKVETLAKSMEPIPFPVRWVHLVRDSPVLDGYVCSECGLPSKVFSDSENCIRCGKVLLDGRPQL